MHSRIFIYTHDSASKTDESHFSGLGNVYHLPSQGRHQPRGDFREKHIQAFLDRCGFEALRIGPVETAPGFGGGDDGNVHRGGVLIIHHRVEHKTLEEFLHHLLQRFFGFVSESLERVVLLAYEKHIIPNPCLSRAGKPSKGLGQFFLRHHVRRKVGVTLGDAGGYQIGHFGIGSHTRSHPSVPAAKFRPEATDLFSCRRCIESILSSGSPNNFLPRILLGAGHFVRVLYLLKSLLLLLTGSLKRREKVCGGKFGSSRSNS